MRFPDTPIMEPVFDLFKLLEREEGLKRFKYYMTDLHENGTRYYNNIVRKRSEGTVTPSGFGITGINPKYGSRGVAANVSYIVDPFKDKLIDDAMSRGDQGWKFMMKYDLYATKGYMAGPRSVDEADQVGQFWPTGPFRGAPLWPPLPCQQFAAVIG